MWLRLGPVLRLKALVWEVWAKQFPLSTFSPCVWSLSGALRSLCSVDLVCGWAGPVGATQAQFIYFLIPGLRFALVV